MAIMLSTRTLREGPGGPSTGADAPQGAKVKIIDKEPPLWVKVQVLGAPDTPSGWVSAAAVDEKSDEFPALDKIVFATQCAWQAIIFGVSAHYMISVAEFRTDITNGQTGEGSRDFGPFAFSREEWAHYSKKDEFAVNLKANDRENWLSQCLVFAIATNITQRALANLIFDQPNATELALAQMIGTKATLQVIKFPEKQLDAVLEEFKESEFSAEGLKLQHIKARYGNRFKGRSCKEIFDELAVEIQSALDGTRQYADAAGAEIITSSAGGLSPSGEVSLNINFESPHIKPDRRQWAVLIATRFQAAGYGTIQQISAIANAIGESQLNPNAKSPPPERSYGLFQLNMAGVGHGHAEDELTDPEKNISIMMNYMATEAKISDKAFRAATSIFDAVSIFVRNFEKPADKVGAINARVPIAKSLTV